MSLRLSGLAVFGVALLTSACATTSAPQKVVRGPDIALPPGQPFALTVESACRGVWKGPTMVARRESSTSDGVFGKVTTTITHKSREGEYGECVQSGLFSQVAAEVQRKAAQALVAAGHRQSPPGEGVAPLKLIVLAEEVRDLQPPSTMKDSGKDTTCQKACGSAECLSYKWEGKVEAEAHLQGPKVAGEAQEAFDVNTGISLGEQHKLGCKGNNPDGWFRDESRYDWRNAYRQLSDELGDRMKGAFAPKNEVASITLFDSGIDAPQNDQGVTLARQQKWTEALAAFDQALSEQQTKDPSNRKAVGRVKHNRAACLMALGKFEDALTAQNDAAQTESDSDIVSLGNEIHRRIVDAVKLQVVKGGADAPPAAPQAPAAPATPDVPAPPPPGPENGGVPFPPPPPAR